MRRRALKIGIAVVVLVALGLVLGPLIYARFADSPETLVSQRLVNDTMITSTDLEGTWEVGEGSIVGYRVDEKIGLADVEGVGRTGAISGVFEVTGGVLESAMFEVDMATLESDRGQRDDQFRTRIMDVAAFPTATFTLSESVVLPTSTVVAEAEPFAAVGNLQLRGTTKVVTVDMFAAIDEGRLRLTGSTEIDFSEWGIPNPSLPAAFIFTSDTGTLEFDLLFAPI